MGSTLKIAEAIKWTPPPSARGSSDFFTSLDFAAKPAEHDQLFPH
jgi:hypothetical protein